MVKQSEAKVVMVLQSIVQQSIGIAGQGEVAAMHCLAKHWRSLVGQCIGTALRSKPSGGNA